MTEHTIDYDNLPHKRNGHSSFAPSGSAMWLNCPGSLIPNLFAPDDAGIDAGEGTVAHGVAEEWLRTGRRPDHLIGTTQKVDQFVISITETMLDFLELYRDWCWELPGTHYVETSVDFSDLTPIPNQTGTADHAACMPGLLVITDLKYGRGEQVFAENNSQALIYAYGFFRRWDWLYNFQRIQIRICQPRLDHFDVWETTRDELLFFAGWVKARAGIAWTPHAPRKVTEKGCRWCKVKSTCPAMAKAMIDMTEGVFDTSEVSVDDTPSVIAEISMLSPDPVNAATLSLRELGRLLPFRHVYEGFFSDVEAECESQAIAGNTVPGYKLVEGRTNREWTSDKAAAFVLEDAGLPVEAIYKSSMISPNQAEEALRVASLKTARRKITKKKAASMIEAVVTKAPGRPTLVPLSDKRREYINPADIAFADEDEAL